MDAQTITLIMAIFASSSVTLTITHSWYSSARSETRDVKSELRDLSRGLSDIRERVTRIETHLAHLFKFSSLPDPMPASTPTPDATATTASDPDSASDPAANDPPTAQAS